MWGIATTDGRDRVAEFRLSADDLTYGFFGMGTLYATGTCTKSR